MDEQQIDFESLAVKPMKDFGLPDLLINKIKLCMERLQNEPLGCQIICFCDLKIPVINEKNEEQSNMLVVVPILEDNDAEEQKKNQISDMVDFLSRKHRPKYVAIIAESYINSNLKKPPSGSISNLPDSQECLSIFLSYYKQNKPSNALIFWTFYRNNIEEKIYFDVPEILDCSNGQLGGRFVCVLPPLEESLGNN